MPKQIQLQFYCHAPNNKCAYPMTECIDPDDEGLPRVCPYLEAKKIITTCEECRLQGTFLCTPQTCPTKLILRSKPK